jgi:diguanylate cyclase (GGDEF)-like protein
MIEETGKSTSAAMIFQRAVRMDINENMDLKELKEFEETRIDREDLDRLRFLTDKRAIERASGDLIEVHIQDEEGRLALEGKMPGTYYQDLIFALIQIRLPEEEAKRDWKEIINHKYFLSEKLGRNVGIHVASLDYYTNIKRKVDNPTIVDVREYMDTASRALTDDLTKAYNRHYFEEELRRLFFTARATGRLFALLMIDLDHFKQYNDVNGHVQGDIALIETVRILHAVCSREQTVARFGGEEFSVLLPDTDGAGAVAAAENIRTAIFDYRFVNEHKLHTGRLSASIGVTAYRSDCRTPLEVIAEADIALYEAKNGGRNQVRAYSRQQPAPAAQAG